MHATERSSEAITGGITQREQLDSVLAVVGQQDSRLLSTACRTLTRPHSTERTERV